MRQWLRNIRKVEGYTCRTIAKIIEVSTSHYTNIENDNRNPHPSTAKAIAKALNFEKYGLDWTAFYDNKQPAGEKNCTA